MFESELFHVIKLDRKHYLLISKSEPNEPHPEEIPLLPFTNQNAKLLSFTPYFTD